MFHHFCVSESIGDMHDANDWWIIQKITRRGQFWYLLIYLPCFAWIQFVSYAINTFLHFRPNVGSFQILQEISICLQLHKVVICKLFGLQIQMNRVSNYWYLKLMNFNERSYLFYNYIVCSIACKLLVNFKIFIVILSINKWKYMFSMSSWSFNICLMSLLIKCHKIVSNRLTCQ